MANRLAKDIMSSLDMIEITIEEQASTASTRVLDEGRSAVVQAADFQPMAILSRSSSRRLLDQSGTLREHTGELTVIGLTVPDHPVDRLMESIALNKSIEGFIVMTENLRHGVIPVRALFDEMRRLGLNYTQMYVNPPNRPENCWCCPAQPSRPAHRVTHGQVKYSPIRQDPICPHHGDLLAYKSPCTDC
jgi:hypothetical protein